jgi:hypothetical protein
MDFEFEATKNPSGVLIPKGHLLVCDLFTLLAELRLVQL